MGDEPTNAVTLKDELKDVKKLANRSDEKVLDVRGFQCPVRYVNDARMVS